MSSGLSDVTGRSHHWIRAFTSAQGINVGGDVVGFCLVDGKGHGYLLSRGVFTFLDVPGTTVLAVNVSAQKAVIGSYSAPDGAGHGYISQDGQCRTRYAWSGFHLCQRNQRGRRCRREIQRPPMGCFTDSCSRKRIRQFTRARIWQDVPLILGGLKVHLAQPESPSQRAESAAVRR